MTRRTHLPEYLMEACGVGLFLVSAGAFATLLEYPDSPVHRAIPNATVRRFLMGLAMGLTAVVNIYSPWGRRSGAHLNPATTLTFWRLGKVQTADAAWYSVAQFIGGAAGAGLVAVVLGDVFTDPPVSAVATIPGRGGVLIAFAAEVAIAFVLISVVLRVNNTPRLAPYTGLVVGGLVMTYITIEAPLSGMSMNPARSLASALAGGPATDLWIYFVAPPFGMLLAAEVSVGWRVRVVCAKMYHAADQQCIFCGYVPLRTRFPDPVETVTA
jgi:aquaporin Z